MSRQEILSAAIEAARKEGLDPTLVAAVIEQESSFDPRAFRAEPHIGDASRGLMQVLYGTAQWMGYTGEADGLYDPQINLTYGCKYLRYLSHRYAGDQRRLLAGYNAGPGNVDTRGWQCVRGYVESVLQRMDRLRPEVEALTGGPPGDEDETPVNPYDRFPLEVPYVSQLEPDGVGYNNCFAGETRFLTSEGTKSLREMVGRTCRVLTDGGSWAMAQVKSFGIQPLLKLTLRRRGHEKVIYTTANHRWFAFRFPRGHDRVQLLTRDLRPGMVLVPMYGQGVGRARPSAFGIAHGIAFGDGTRVRDRQTPATVVLAGKKDAELLRYFPLSPRRVVKEVGVRVSDLPRYFKDRPSIHESRSYLYGWLAGYFAADGKVDADGGVTLHSASRENLEFVRDVCTRLGIGTYPLVAHNRMGFGVEPTPLYSISFQRHRLREDFFLLRKHRERVIAAGLGQPTTREQGWTVAALEPSDRMEEVFCAVVPDTHSFVLEDNVLTGNCGPACVTMALAYNGFAPANRQVLHLVAEEIRGKPWNAGTYTNFQQMQAAAARFHIPNHVLFSWPEVFGALDSGQPVVILVDNRCLEPRQYPRSPAFDAHHFIVLLGYDAEEFHAADPLSVFTRGPVTYTRSSVAAGVDNVEGVQAIAVDQPGPAEEAADEEELEVPIIRISDEDLRGYLEQLGQGVNMDSGIIKRACLAYRRGETRGPAISDEYPASAPDGRDVVRQQFTAGIAEYDPGTGEVNWVEVVSHPEAVARSARSRAARVPGAARQPTGAGVQGVRSVTQPVGRGPAVPEWMPAASREAPEPKPARRTRARASTPPASTAPAGRQEAPSRRQP